MTPLQNKIEEAKIESELAVFWNEMSNFLPKTRARAELGDQAIFAAFKALYPIMRTHIATLAQEEARKEMVEKIRKSKIWKLVPNTPRMIMCSDKELDDLLSTLSNNTLQ